jgi:hypothetical protein
MKKKEKTEVFTTSWGSKITLTVDENLNKLKGKNLAPKKLEETNKALSQIKHFPK